MPAVLIAARPLYMENFARGMNDPPTVFFHPKGTSGQAFRFDDKSYPGDGASLQG
jgi:hypothetical protein